MDSQDDTSSHLRWDNKDKKFCHIEQVAVITCMQAMNTTDQGDEKSKRSNECYLPSVTAWNECVARGVGYL